MVFGFGTWAVDNKVDKSVGKELIVVATDRGKTREQWGVKVSLVVKA
jgi:hypothetical protein